MSTTRPSSPDSATFPLVSVIIPTYNRARMVKEAIDSVLMQDYQNVELIVVDDGSTDNTPSVLASYGDRLSVRHQRNSGVSAARNLGIRSSSGQLIALLDSDDYWLPGKLSAQVEYFRNTPQAQICQTDEIWIRNGIRVNPKARHRKRSGMIFKSSLALCLISPSAVMMRRSLLDKVGLFDDALPACEDYDLWLRITWQYSAHLISSPLIVKRGGHDDQLSRRPELDRYRICSIVKILDKGVLAPDDREAACRVLKEKCAIYAGGCRKRGRLEEAGYFEALGRKFDSDCL